MTDGPPADHPAAGLVLAAGRGRRFGDATKQLALLDGRPLVAHVAATALAADLDPVVVVVGHDAAAVTAALPTGARAVHNPDFARGQSTSLRTGLDELARLDTGPAVVLLADEPDVGAAAIRAVVAALRDGARVVRCAYDDRPGHPVGLARGRWAAAAAGGDHDEGARWLVRGDAVTLVDVAGPAPVDVDHVEDLPDGPPRPAP